MKQRCKGRKKNEKVKILILQGLFFTTGKPNSTSLLTFVTLFLSTVMPLSQQWKRKIRICGKNVRKTYSLLSFFFNKYRLPLVLCWPFSVFYRFRVDLGPFHAWGLGSWTGIDPRNFASDPWSLSFQIESPSPGTWLLISAPTYFVRTLKWRFLKEKLRASLYYPASMIRALWVGGKDRWRGKGAKVRGYSWEFLGGGGGAARSNPDRISDQKMSFFTAVFRPQQNLFSYSDLARPGLLTKMIYTCIKKIDQKPMEMCAWIFVNKLFF